jgi:hypothetical protein
MKWLPGTPLLNKPSTEWHCAQRSSFTAWVATSSREFGNMELHGAGLGGDSARNRDNENNCRPLSALLAPHEPTDPTRREILTNDFGGTVAAFYASSGNSSVKSAAVLQYGSRFGDTGYPVFQVQPTLGGTGHVYAIYCTLPNTATTPDETVEIVTSDGTLSTNKTLAFSDWNNGVQNAQRNTWNLIGYLTNNPGVYQPTVTFMYATT